MHRATSYLILAPGPMQNEKDIKKAAGICLESVALDPEMYRLGHTKARNYFYLLLSCVFPMIFRYNPRRFIDLLNVF
jgi:hypothetical protein